LLPPVLLGAGAVALMLALNPMRSERVYSWLHLEETRQGVGYQAWQARLALGAGGPVGVGLNRSRQRSFSLSTRPTSSLRSSARNSVCGQHGRGDAVRRALLCGMRIAAEAADRLAGCWRPGSVF